VIVVTIYFVELYVVKKDKKNKYKALMKKIHKSLREHAGDLPELLSYRTFEAGTEGPLTRFVEMFEFADQDGRERFFRRFSETKWLRTLEQHFHELVPRCRKIAWAEFLRDEWLVR